MDPKVDVHPRPSLVRNIAGWSLLACTAGAFVLFSPFVATRRLVRPVKNGLRLAFRAFGLRVRVIGLERLPAG